MAEQLTEAALAARIATWGIKPQRKIKDMAHDLFAWMYGFGEDTAVWCNVHGCVHEPSDDPYDTGQAECCGDYWDLLVAFVLDDGEG